MTRFVGLSTKSGHSALPMMGRISSKLTIAFGEGVEAEDIFKVEFLLIYRFKIYAAKLPSQNLFIFY